MELEGYRTESDFLGEKQISNDAYYGIHTLRAKENFCISSFKLGQYPILVVALAQVKKASALANQKVNKLSPELTKAICAACDEIIEGKFHDQFIVDLIQGGAGTSTNMNANEVIANRANEILGHNKGDYHIVHPINHVNLSQSTNDIYPTAFRMALYEKLYVLETSMENIEQAFSNKAQEFKTVLKMGRTQLQDAVPMTLGQEFQTYATMINADLHVLQRAKYDARKINLGGTAIGTGINTHSDYSHIIKEQLELVTGNTFNIAEDLIEATQDTAVFVLISGILKRIAVKVSKICNDLRLLSSGPRAGLNEINLPPMQPGSSIMPGKVNPVIPEVVNQVAFDVIGADVTISMASEAGQLQLNVFEPIIFYKLFQSIIMLSRALDTLAEKCVKGITANEQHCKELLLNSAGIVTALTPLLGYQTCSDVVKEALKRNCSVYDVIIERGLLTATALEELLEVSSMISPK